MTPRRDRGYAFKYGFDFLVNGLASVVDAAQIRESAGKRVIPQVIR